MTLIIFTLLVALNTAQAAQFTQKELAYMPATVQIELFKRGVITPVDVLKAQKAQFDATNNTVRAVFENRY